MSLIEEGFYRFWAEYPKKRSKGDAFNAWRVTAPRRPELQVLLKALAVLKSSEDWTKEGGKFIPYPGTWLRAWGWDDVPEVEMADVVNGKMWWQTSSGTEAKAKELGIDPWNGRFNGEPESWQQWAKRVKAQAESSKVIPINRAA